MRTSRPLRIFVALFNAIAALGLAGFVNIGPQALLPELQEAAGITWWVAFGALAALVAVVLEAPLLGWAAIGLVLWSVLGVVLPLGLLFGALALSLMPITPRPGGSLVAGFLVAVGTLAGMAVAQVVLPV